MIDLCRLYLFCFPLVPEAQVRKTMLDSYGFIHYAHETAPNTYISIELENFPGLKQVINS